MRDPKGKDVYSIRDLIDKGYPERLIRILIKSDHFSEYGFRMGKTKNSKAFFYLPKVERFIESQMDEYKGVIG